MAPKTRKSLSNCCWCTCEDCGVLLTQKDMQQHINLSCPPDSREWRHPFIKNKVLYSYVEHYSVNDTPKVKAYENHMFVFLSQSAMQLCNIEVGEEVVLTFNNNDSITRTVWPTAEKKLSSVVMFPFQQALKKKFCEEGCQVKVMKLVKKPEPALYIRLSCPYVIGRNATDELLAACKYLYTGKSLKIGSEIMLPYFGKTLSLLIKDITPSKCQTEDTTNLSKEFEKLKVEKLPTDDYFIAIEASKWELSLNIEKNKNDLPEKFICLKNIGGYSQILQELAKTTAIALKGEVSPNYLTSNLGILLHGPSGVGKTYIAQALSNELNVHVVKINSGELFSKFFGETEVRLQRLFTEAKEKNPSIIILDNIDTLCSKHGRTEQEKRVITYMLTLLDSLNNSKIVVLATTSRLNLIDSSLRRPGRLDCEIELPVPLVQDRFEILKIMLSKWTIEDSEIMKIASAAHGYVAADLQYLVTKATMQAMALNKTEIDTSDLFWALSQTRPSAMQEVRVQVPNVKWSDIGGMDDLKLKLQQAVEWPLKYPESFSRLGVKPPRGILMYGPPGCSKTMFAKAIATESNLNFLSIKGSEIFSKWVGESEKSVQSLFRKARAVAPSIVFLDELDALGGERSGSSEGNNVQERVLAQLLTEMDGVEPLGNVNIVAATNRPDRVDKALLRPGRLDRMVYVPLPDLATRVCILKLQTAKMPVASDFLISDVALKTEGYSGAEVIAVCHEAAINALQEDFDVNEVCQRHFDLALDVVKPRTPVSLLNLYNTYSN